jgi:amino acid transporter
MDWLGKGAVGLVLMVAGVAGFGFCLYQLIKTGTCGSGGPYVYAVKACPSSTGAYIVGLIGGIFAFLIGGAIFAVRGRNATEPGLPPAKDDPTANPKPFSTLY